jgi:hypothetical protein
MRELYQVGQILITRDSTYEILGKADQVDHDGKMNLFVKITRTTIPYKGKINYSCVTEDWLLNWVNTHLKYPLPDNMEYYSNNGTQLFEGELFTIEDKQGVFKCRNQGGIGLIRVNGALYIPFQEIVEMGYKVLPY